MTIVDTLNHYRLGKLNYAVREGESAHGQPMIVLHGLIDVSESFLPMIDAIEAAAPGRFRFMVPDWRGHGHSERVSDTYWFPEYLLDLERLIDALVPDSKQPVILVGHSMGGQVAAQYAGVRPKRIRKLITLDSLNVPDAGPADTPARYRRWLDAQASPPTERVYEDVDAFALRIGKRYPELDDAQLAALAERWTETVDGSTRRRMRHDPWHRASAAYGFRLDEAMALWREVTAAVLCIDAAHSIMRWITEDDEMARRRACFADITHVRLDDCGHMLHVQRPDALAKAICDFLAEHD